MIENHIIFSGPMVRAILAGTKTQTRRVVKVAAKNLVFDLVKAWKDGPRPFNTGEYLHVPFRHKDEDWSHDTSERVFCPYGQPGDRLWVKETHKPHFDAKKLWTCVKYKADGAMVKPTLWTENEGFQWEARDKERKWTHSIFMPRFASRITLEITGVRVERLQDISEEDAKAEGCARTEDEHGIYSATVDYCELWESINGAGSWALNPWVWVIKFRRVES